MSKRELKALGVESASKRIGLRTLSGKERVRKTSEANEDTMDTEAVRALKDKVAELEAKLTEALRSAKDKGTELDAQVALQTTTREELDREHADAGRLRKEVDELRSKVSSLERERDALKSRSDPSTGSRDSGLMETFEKFIEAQTKMMSARRSQFRTFLHSLHSQD